MNGWPACLQKPRPAPFSLPILFYICPVKEKWFIHIRYFLFWVLFFIGGKCIFLLYHSSKAENLGLAEMLQVFLYGLRLDASFAAYLSVLPFLFFLIRSLVPRLDGSRWLLAYTLFFVLFQALLAVADLELYQAWGFRLDATPLQYLSTPREMLASAGTAPLGLLTALFLLLGLGGGYHFYRRFRQLPRINYRSLAYSFWCFFLLIVLILPIRGGWQQIPLNQSDVYFSDRAFANHAAVNVSWNLMYSISKKNYDQHNPYAYLPDSVAQSLVQGLYQQQGKSKPASMLAQPRPNVLFIILESYTGKLVGSLGGEPGATPNLDRIAREGILFDSIYASGDRSEKGLVALLSAYPVQTTTSIIKTPRKTEHLPHINKVLKNLGYATSFYYGGELAFANIKSYLLNAGYARLLGKFDFDDESYNAKWGVHDHILFDRVLKDLNQEKEPFFSTVFTLSSHEPYDIPIPAKFKGPDEATQFKNSVYYTDYALGKFWDAARKEPWWDNTLVVLAADHGHRLPGNEANDAPGKFHIPFILAGGALKQQATVISQIGSQTDIVPTVLHLMNLPTADFHWGKNLLDAGAGSFAFYVFNDGFGFITPKGVLTFDNVSKKAIRQDPGVPPAQVEMGKAYMQHSFGDFLRK
jgi:phosphoglycerol transferase MdoB-like AlkP superfamily enzyme